MFYRGLMFPHGQSVVTKTVCKTDLREVYVLVMRGSFSCWVTPLGQAIPQISALPTRGGVGGPLFQEHQASRA
jgi:hypothetical protein